MSTSTSHSPQEQGQVEEGACQSTAGHTLQGWLVILLVFVAGAASLAVEMAASRLLAPYFGSSISVWACLIGLILLYLTAGYYIGGRLADRYPQTTVLYWLTIAASLLIAVIPLLATPVLNWSLNTFATSPDSEFYGSLVPGIVLFVLPMILLGCVSPYAIRLRIKQVGNSGHVSGQIYAITTLGSIVGTFLPVLVLMPDIGTAKTFVVFAGALLLFSLSGLLCSRRQYVPKIS
jgi:predicted membrane-bound spermidine synthase